MTGKRRRGVNMTNGTQRTGIWEKRNQKMQNRREYGGREQRTGGRKEQKARKIQVHRRIQQRIEKQTIERKEMA